MRLNPTDLEGRGCAAFNGAAQAFPQLYHMHKAAHDLIVSGETPERIVLFPCHVDGKPTSAIGILVIAGNSVMLTPVFIAPTVDMAIADQNGRATAPWPEGRAL